MKVNVIKRFVDINTKELHKVGEVLDVEAARGKNLVSRGLAEAVKADKEEVKKIEKND